jgi:hypothetical protein
VFAALASLFPEPEPFTLIEGRGEETIDFEHMGVRYRLVCAPGDAALAALATLAPDDGVRDLYTGGETTVSDVRAHIARGTRRGHPFPPGSAGPGPLDAAADLHAAASR